MSPAMQEVPRRPAPCRRRSTLSTTAAGAFLVAIALAATEALEKVDLTILTVRGFPRRGNALAGRWASL